MSNKIFVGGLAWATSDEGLRAAFEQFGPVTEAKVIMERDTGRSRGFGFVSFDDRGAMESAIQEMDGKELDGRAIRVNMANDRPDGGRGGRRGDRRR